MRDNTNKKEDKKMAHPTITIERPNGKIETVEVPNLAIINDFFFDKIKTATENAGRGKVLSYQNPTIELDYSGECERCGKRIEDIRKAHTQKEWERGQEITVAYCDTCAKLLHTVGAGEKTAMQDRQSKVGYAPEIKSDF